jgi:putative ABC transport system permease protein
MQLADYVLLGLGALRSHRLRSFLSTLGIAIGITAVILLTSIGEGTRRYLIAEFTQFGTNILQINPGKTETMGLPGVLGGTTHKLTLDDAEALERLPSVQKAVPLAFGQARVEGNGRGRSVLIYGATSDVPEVWKFGVGQGSFLPPGDPRRGSTVAVGHRRDGAQGPHPRLRHRRRGLRAGQDRHADVQPRRAAGNRRALRPRRSDAASGG